MRPADPPRSAFCLFPLLLLLLLLLLLFFLSAISTADANLLRCATVLWVLIIFVLSCPCGPQGCKNRPAPFSARTLNPIHSTIHHGWSLFKASFSTGMLGLSCFQSWSWCFKAWSRSRSYKTESCLHTGFSPWQVKQETQLSLTYRATRLEVSQGHQTWYHSICYVWFPITVL